MGDFDVHALRGVSLTVERGDFVAIMGASGSGKSTLMNILGCLDVPTRGHFFLDGIDVRTLDEAALSHIRNRKIGFVFQSFNLIPRTTALANVELPLLYAGVQAKERRARAAGGARGGRARRPQLPLPQRDVRRPAAAGRARARDRDRPGARPRRRADREPRHRHEPARSWRMFSRLNADGRTIILITHEEEIAAYAKRVVRLRDGLIIDDRRRVPVARLRAARRRSRRGRRDRAREAARMNLLDTLRIAWRGATANKLRSALTVLGVLIGVSAVIILLAVGTGSSQAVAEPDQRARDEHDHRAQPRPLRARPRDDGDAVPERDPDRCSR